MLRHIERKIFHQHSINSTTTIKYILQRFIGKFSYCHNPGTVPLLSQTLGQLLEDAVSKWGDNLLVKSCHQNDEILTFYQTLSKADRFAAALDRLGLRPGDTVGIWAPNVLEWYITKMACARAGFISVDINPTYESSEILYCINKVGLKALICGDTMVRQRSIYERFQEAIPEITNGTPGNLTSKHAPSLKTVIVISDKDLDGTYNFEEVMRLGTEDGMRSIQRRQNLLQFDDPCNIQFTSGTTGAPKAAVLTHFAIVNNSFYVGRRNQLTPDAKICCMVPFFHSFGTVCTMIPSLHYGNSIILPSDTYSPTRNLETIEKEECTIAYGTPTMFIDLINLQKRNKTKLHLKMVTVGGASCPSHLSKEIINVLKVEKLQHVYGMTELGPVCFQSEMDEDDGKVVVPGTVGYIYDHVQAKVIDQNGCVVSFGTPGELCIKSFGMMLGYWNDAEKTRNIIGPDGWLRTGDQFILQEDGYGRVVGRLKELIIRGGENIFPIEIEEYLNTHPKILEVYVIGLPHERLGEEVCACVRLKDDNVILTLDEIHDFCHGHFAPYKIPTKLRITSVFPKTASGKIQKFKLCQTMAQSTL